MKYEFKHAPVEGVIKSRPNRFIMMVKLGNSLIKCHCPSTGRIGNIIFENTPCLLSKSENKDRKTSYTVEAISLDPVGKTNKSWIGINQNRVNEYIEFFLKNGQLSKIVKKGNVEREKKLGSSRIDFLVGNTYVEVKMPLTTLPQSEGWETKEYEKFNSFDRLIKHYSDLSKSITKKSKAIVLLCYLYDAQPFKLPSIDKNIKKIQRVVKESIERGVENWQVNLKIDENGVSLLRYFKLKLF